LASLVFLIWVIPTYTPAYPGYGVPASMVPNVTVGGILLLSVLALVRNLITQARTRQQHLQEGVQGGQVDRVHLLHLVKFLLPCILLMPAMKWLGFLPAAIMFMLVIQFFCNQRKPVALILVALIPPGIIYAAMRFLLGVPMP
jgi:hypothetical protein